MRRLLSLSSFSQSEADPRFHFSYTIGLINCNRRWEQIWERLQFYLMKHENALRGNSPVNTVEPLWKLLMLSGKRKTWFSVDSLDLPESDSREVCWCCECINYFVVSSWFAVSLSHRAASSGLLNSSKLHLVEKQKLRWTKSAREEQCSLLINEFGPTLCLPHPDRLRVHPLFLSLFSKLPQTDFNQSFTTYQSLSLSNFCAAVMSEQIFDSSPSHFHDLKKPRSNESWILQEMSPPSAAAL